MTESGAEGGDPFFDVVRRRHPDVDIVLLPPETEEPEPAATAAVPEDEARVDALALDLDQQFRELWEQVAERVPEPDGSPRWNLGPGLGTIRREVLLAATGVDVVAAHETLDRAERVLQERGWHVLAPDTGLPRVLAGRDPGDRPDTAVEARPVEVELVWVAASARLAMTVRSGPLAVGDAEARRRTASW